MNFLSLIEAKRDGHALSPKQLAQIIESYVAGKIPDYQMAAFLMAVYFQGLTSAETAALTCAMRDSGEVLQFPAGDPRPLVDKHSTGGVGDKISLPLAPLLACLGFRVPMISGRGLGITGGTLDKLDAIPGFKSLLPADQIVTIVNRIGCVICGQTERMVPADRAMYALRDVTATVPSIPLIVASILSKKLAEGLHSLVLDVKFGRAAFMPTVEKARELAAAMVRLAKDCGVNTRALITSMDHPLGSAAGNWLEVKESVELLKGSGSAGVHELVVGCAAELLVQSRKAPSREAGLEQAAACLRSGAPLEKWNEMLLAQGADLKELDRLMEADSLAPCVVPIPAPRSGYVAGCCARTVGEVVRDLGGGRLTKESRIDYRVGIDRIAQPGNHVSEGASLGRVHAADVASAQAARDRIQQAFAIADAPPPLQRRIVEIVE